MTKSLEKQVANEKRNKKVVAAWEEQLLKGVMPKKAEFAAQFDISPRTLNRILDEAGIRGMLPVQPSAAEPDVSDEKTETPETEVAPDEPEDSNDEGEVESESVDAPSDDEPETTAEPEKEPANIISWTVGANRFISCLMDDGETLVVDTDHENYDIVLQALIGGDFPTAAQNMSVRKKLEALNFGAITVGEDGVFLNGRRVENDIVPDMIKVFMREEEVTGMVNFLKNLLLVENQHIYDSLWKLLKHEGMKITDDGLVECFKRVDADYKDCYTHTIDNSVGAEVMMDRRAVDHNHNTTCSQGLHVCAFQYLSNSGYGARDGAKVVKVVVRPQDFVAIPSDYKFTKARTCFYKVVADVTEAANRGDFDAA